MRRVLAAAILLLPAMCAAQEAARPAPRVQDKRSEEIERYLEWLGSDDKEVRELAARKLAELGKSAVPHLEKLLAAKGAMEVYKILKEIEVPKFVAARPWGEAEFTLDDPSKELPKVEHGEVEKYVYSKLALANAYYKQKMYAKAYELAKAMLLLEPTSGHAGQLNALARVCDNLVAQTSLLKTTVTCERNAAVFGEKVEFMLRMENVFRNRIELGYQETKETVKGSVIVEVLIDVMDPVSGATTSGKRSFAVEVEGSIPIAMGAQWEKAIEVETAGDFADDKECLRKYTIGAWTQPGKLDVGYGNQARKLIFMPGTVWVVPKKFEHLLDEPLKRFHQAIDVGMASEVFIAAMILTPTQREEAVDTLIDRLEKVDPKNVRGRAMTARMLIFLTGQGTLGDDPKAWREWRKQKDAAPPKQEPGKSSRK